MKRWACRFCVASHGLRGTDIESLPAIDDEAAQAEHLESVHHIPVRRANETDGECAARFAREQPEAGGPNCRCPKCTADRTAAAAV